MEDSNDTGSLIIGEKVPDVVLGAEVVGEEALVSTKLVTISLR